MEAPLKMREASIGRECAINYSMHSLTSLATMERVTLCATVAVACMKNELIDVKNKNMHPLGRTAPDDSDCSTAYHRAAVKSISR